MISSFKQDFQTVLDLFHAGRVADAEGAAQALTAAHPGAALAHNILGVIQASAGKADAAAASFGKAIAADPGLDEAHGNLGLLNCNRRDFAAAVENFRAALVLNPGNVVTEVNLGNALRELGQLDLACASYRRALAAGGPHEALIANNLGAALSDLGRSEEAIVCFRRATDLQPTYAEAHRHLGRELQRMGRLEESLAAYECASQHAPAAADAVIAMADTLRALGRLEEAVAAYDRALRLRPADRAALYHQGLSLMDLGRHAEGLAAISRGPGIARLSPAEAVDRRRVSRVELAGGAHFIGAWLLPDPGVCRGIVDFFESHPALHSEGRTGGGIDKAVKNSTDITVLPNDLGRPDHAPVADYLRQLQLCYGDYVAQWPYLGGMLPQADLVPFTIQRYRPGGHFQKPHSERTSFGYIHRVLAWMTYLNDVDDGGETCFHHFGINVRPERGKTLIWPAEWTHLHSGGVVTAGDKYIITGWMHFPHERAAARPVSATG